MTPWTSLKARAQEFVYSPSGNAIAVSAFDGGLWFYNFNRASWSYERVHHSQVRSGRFSPDGQTFISASRDGSVVLKDLPSRLAVIAAAWGTLSLFYPYFSDQQIDWSRELRPAFIDAVNAHTIKECHLALAVLLTKLHDNHARAYHPIIKDDGILPIALRRFGNSLIVVGALEMYSKQIPVGSEILSIDGIPTERLYEDTLAHVSVATPGWASAIVPFWVTLGRLGALSDLKIKVPTGATLGVALPRLSRVLYEDLLHEPRPATGVELRPGVYYVNLDRLALAQWQSALPSLAHARTVILDMRGYPGNAGFEVLGHFIDHEIRSPEWRIPIFGTNDFEILTWGVRPTMPKLDAKAIVLVDGRAVSAAETLLQIVRDNALASLVGEPSAGTNGNVTFAKLPQGFSIRFTGLRVQLKDGTALQGRGIRPDMVVHPTPAGVRAGRDEILEAALELATRP
jgi:hypothetical protein